MLKQSLQQKLQQKLSPQQIQLMKLLQVPTLELEARIKEELEANPALEEGREEEAHWTRPTVWTMTAVKPGMILILTPTSTTQRRATGTPSTTTPSTRTGRRHLVLARPFRERLSAQIGLLPVSDRQRMLAAFLIGNLDEAGYLRRDLYAITSDLAFGQGVEVEEEELEAVLEIVQKLDPAGVGARDFRECLLLQIDRKLEARWR